MSEHRVRGTRRVWVPALVLALFAGLIGTRLVQLQVLRHEDYAALARSELQANTTEFAQRGTILDRNGSVLALSVDTWDIYVSARNWRDAAVAIPASQELATILSADPVELRQKVLAIGEGDVLIQRDVPYETGRLAIERRIAGVVGLPNSERVYPEGDTAASVLGLVGLDNNGLAGLEAALDEQLRGEPGRAIYERATTGAPIPFGQYLAQEPVPGMDVVLTIDRYLQQLAEETLDRAIADHQAKGGAIVIVNPHTMDVLALASRPSFEYSTLDLSNAASAELLRNRSVTDTYEPGSVMKLVTAAAAIDAGVVSPHTTYVDTGVADIYGTEINNWEHRTYGEQTMTGVLQHSINTGAIFMAELLGAERFHQYMEAFGFGAPTGIELTGEAEGIIRRPEDPGWSPVDLATQSFGQSISVTPMQMVTAIAAAINGGKVMRPHLVDAYITPDGERIDVQPEVVNQAITPEASDQIRWMLGEVVYVNEWHPGQPENYTAGGKSGTANVPIPNGAYDEQHVASFAGFAPLDDPEILVLVKLDENADLETGTVAAGPVFAEIVDRTLAHLNVPPDAASYAREP